MRKESLECVTPTVFDYIHAACEDFIEVRGDRLASDDRRIVCGYGKISGRSVALIAYDLNGRADGPNGGGSVGLSVNGYRKAFRLMRLAEKFDHPLLILTVAPASLSSIVAKKPCEAHAFARHVQTIWQLQVPAVLIILGRRGSGDIFSIWMADRILTSEHVSFSMTLLDQQLVQRRVFVKAKTLESHKIIDTMVPDLLKGPGKISRVMAEELRHSIECSLGEVLSLPPDQLVRERAARAKRIFALKLDHL